MSPHRTPPPPGTAPARAPHASQPARDHCGRHPLRLALAAIVILILPAPATHAADKKGPEPAKAASQYAAFDAHPDEHVTIAADPCDDPKLCPFFRLPYIQHGLLPVRVVVTNDSDHAISLADARIQFISANNDKIPAATEDDINRRLFTIKSDEGTKIPIIPITIHHPVDKKIVQDDDEFGFASSTVKPHSTLAGYLFYDIKDLEEPALAHAEIYVKMVHPVGDGNELFSFSIPFDKWLAANPDAPSNHRRN